MQTTKLSAFAAALGLTLAASAPLALAAPATVISLEDLMPMAPDFKKALNLNANQQLLWQQTETRTRTAMRNRQVRREALQAALTQDLTNTKAELRDIAKKMDAESALSNAEELQIRELWLTVNDALDDVQRAKVIGFFAEQLQRNLQGEAPKHDGEARHPAEQGGKGGKRGGMGGGQGGMGGKPGISIGNQ